MKRIVVLGNCGAGKSTFARRLHTMLGLPLIHLDHLYWKPGWTPTDSVAFEQEVTALCATPEWIIDGTYYSTLKQRMDRAEGMIFLDFPTRVCFLRVVRRILNGYGQSRSDCGNDCPERLDLPFLKFVLEFRRTRRPRLLEMMQQYPHLTRYHITHLSETEETLKQIRDAENQRV